jgi:hypothetical protein
MPDYKQWIIDQKDKMKGGGFQNRPTGPGQTLNPMAGSLINQLRQEWGALTKSPAGGIVKRGLEEVGKSFARPFAGVGQATRKYGEFMGSPIIERAGRTAETFWGEKAGIPKRPIQRNVWVTKEGPEAYRKAQGGIAEPLRKPEGAETGTDVTVPPKTGVSAATTSAKAKTRIVPGTTFRERLPAVPEVAPMKLPVMPGGQQMGKYRDIAKMSLEQWNKYRAGEVVPGFERLGALPEGDRPIHTIRGTGQKWFSPRTSEEYETRAGSVTGLHGKAPTVQDIMKREEKVFEEGAKGERTRYAHDKAVESAIKSARTRGEYNLAERQMMVDSAARLATTKAAGRGGGGISSDESWTVASITGPEGEEESWAFDKKSAKAFPINPSFASSWAGMLNQYATKKQFGKAAEFLESITGDKETMDAIVRELPATVANRILAELERREKGRAK